LIRRRVALPADTREIRKEWLADRELVLVLRISDGIFSSANLSPLATAGKQSKTYLRRADKVACRWSLRGPHQGDLMSVASTGKVITITGIAIFRIANGKIQAEWAYADGLGLMQSLVSVLCKVSDSLSANRKRTQS
jgi:hypothetical protein